MIKKLHILILILTSIVSFTVVNAQYTDKVCTGMTRVYRIAALPGSTLNWKVNGGGNIVNNWNDSIEVIWTGNGVYTIEAEQISAAGCRASTSAQILVGNKPELSLGNDHYICKGKTLQLDAGSGFAEYYWNNHKGDQTYTVNAEGWYRVTAYTAEGCKVSDSINVNMVDNPSVNLGNNLSLCGDENAELDAGADGPYYNWSNNNSTSRFNTVYAVITPQYITVKVTNTYGCSSSDSILLNPCDYSKFAQLIPNTFTPSDDNSKNNTWFIPWLYQFPKARVEIFDRWGQSVYTSNNGLPAQGWDGKRNGKYLPTDSYYYVIDLRNGTKPITGTVTIVR
jgi:gliding motility-associated-like protein